MIEHWDLKEIELPGRRLTWSNNQVDPILAKLYRFLICTEWEKLYPLAFINMLARDASDHSPLILNLGLRQEKITKLFKFE